MSGQGQKPDATNRSASAAEIIRILGQVDGTVLVDIQRTGATAAEVLEAFARLEADDAVGPVTGRGAAPRVVEVMAVLQAAELGPERDPD